MRSPVTWKRRAASAWQIYDDLADFFGEETRSGKTPGTALASGKLTLPLLALLERLSPAEADALRAEIVGKQPPQLALRLRQMRELALFPVIAEAVHAEIAAAAAALREWPGHPSTPLLLGLCDGLRAQVEELRPTGTA